MEGHAVHYWKVLGDQTHTQWPENGAIPLVAFSSSHFEVHYESIWMEIKESLLSGRLTSLPPLMYLCLCPSALLSGTGFSFLWPSGSIPFVFHEGGMCMCVNDAFQSHLIQAFPPLTNFPDTKMKGPHEMQLFSLFLFSCCFAHMDWVP